MFCGLSISEKDLCGRFTLWFLLLLLFAQDFARKLRKELLVEALVQGNMTAQVETHNTIASEHSRSLAYHFISLWHSPPGGKGVNVLSLQVCGQVIVMEGILNVHPFSVQPHGVHTVAEGFADKGTYSYVRMCIAHWLRMTN